MPRQPQKHSTPLWHVRDELSKKKGSHSTVHFMNGDEYTGEWENNMKHGRGKYIFQKSGEFYEGEWKNDKRHGFGSLFIPRGSIESNSPNSNSGTISDQKKEPTKKSSVTSPFPRTSHTRSMKRNNGGDMVKVYEGEWMDDKKQGVGTYYYEDGVSVYEGKWMNNKREGWGVMRYKDGSRYEGEFYNEMRHGQGVLILTNGDRFEGMWINDCKEGPGKFYYESKGQCYDGEWSKDLPKCGVIQNYTPLTDEMIRGIQLPVLELANAEAVLNTQRQEILQERVSRLLSQSQADVFYQTT